MIKKLVLGGMLVALIGALALLMSRWSQSESTLAYQEHRWEDSTQAPAGAKIQETGYRADLGENPGAAIGDNAADNAAGSRDGQAQAVVSDWITLEGTVTAVELNALTIETAEGQSILIQLGPENFWTTQGTTLQEGDEVAITGFYEDGGTYSAGEVIMLKTGETLALRDADGRPLWSGGSGNSRSGQVQKQGGNNK